MAALGAGFFLAVSTPLIPVMILNSLESQFEPLDVETLTDIELSYHIIVLGGGHGFDDRLPANSLLSEQALSRLSEGIRLHRQLPNSKLVLSGFSSSGRTTQAEMLQKTAVLLGVSYENTITQKEPENTYEEAKVYADRFGNSHPLIVVTSAAHMPRAIFLFQHQGTDPMASPAHYRLKGSGKQKWFGLPSVKNMELMKRGLHEWAALKREQLLRNRQQKF